MIFRVKQYVLAFLYWVDQYLPVSIGMYIRNRCWPWRPVLDAVELHLADRCNMNCTGCAHFSPFAAEWYADVDSVERDLTALRGRFCGGIRHVNLLGGEPLLHRDVVGIIRRVRRACPNAMITLVTNGLKLLDEPSSFWQACREVGIRLNLTLYKPMAARRESIEKKCREEGVCLRVQIGDVFFAKTVPEGTAKPQRSFRLCRNTTYCPYLREGRLYRCAQEYHIADFLDGVGGKGGLLIDDEKLTAKCILAYLMTPGKICAYCSDRLRLFPWSQGSRDKSDWCYKKK